MVRTGWASKEEREYLTSLMPEYEACQVRRRYKTFWQRVNAEFLTKFPVMDKLFPGRKITELLVEEKEMYTAARLKEWFRWQLNPRSRNAGTVLSKKDLRTIYHGRTRILKPYEVFAKVYPMEVEIVKKARCESLGISGRETLAVWHEVAKELYQSANLEQLEAVKKRTAEDRDTDNVQLENNAAPESYVRYLRKLPGLLDATITPAVRKAGVLAFVTIVGPEPEQNGKITCKSFQFGDKPDTPIFSQVWEDHDTIFSEELARFARRHEFPPDVCAARSTNRTAVAVSNTEQNDENIKHTGVSRSGDPSGVASQVVPKPRESSLESRSPASANIEPPPQRTAINANQPSPVSVTCSSNIHTTVSVSKSKTSSYEAPFFDSPSSEDSINGEQQNDSQTGMPQSSGKAPSAGGPLFLRRGNESDEEEEDDYDGPLVHLSQEKWDEIDRRLQATPSPAPIFSANMPATLHTFAALTRPAQASISPNSSHSSFEDDINMFNDPSRPEPRSMIRTSMIRTTMSGASPAPRVESSGNAPVQAQERPRPRPTMTQSRPSNLSNDKRGALEFDHFNLAQRHSQSDSSKPSTNRVPPMSPFAISRGRALPSDSSSSTRLSSAKALQSLSPRTTSSGWPNPSQPSRASRFLGSILDGSNVATQRTTPKPKSMNNDAPSSKQGALGLTTVVSPQSSLSSGSSSQSNSVSHAASGDVRDASSAPNIFAPSPFCTTPLPEYDSARFQSGQARLLQSRSANIDASNAIGFGYPNAASQEDVWLPDLEVSMQNCGVAEFDPSYFDAPSALPTGYNPVPSLDGSMVGQSRPESRVGGEPQSAKHLQSAGYPSHPSPRDRPLNRRYPSPTIADPAPNPLEVEMLSRQPSPSGPTSPRNSPHYPIKIPLPPFEEFAGQQFASRPASPVGSPRDITANPPPPVKSLPVVSEQPSQSRATSPIGSPDHTTGNPSLPDTNPAGATVSAHPLAESNDKQQVDAIPDTNRRRSTRACVPSKRDEQLQKIGTNTTPVSDAAEAPPPAWFVLASENLESYDLGEEWSKLIGNWAVLEGAMGYGKLCKGSLGAKGRPEEWTKWTSKNWQGTRRYDKVPVIDDPADLTIAMWNWWSSLQPSFRASEDAFPLQIFSPPDPSDGADAWGTLRKSGPNGFVSILMLMAWCGKAAMSERQDWEEDSLASWRLLAQDVTRVLDSMTASGCGPSSNAGTKRPLEKENAAPSTHRRKRKRV